jgi:serine/threonine-protein kinase
MPLQEGEIVGPYRIISQLGQGGMATVYKGYHENLDRHVAIKMMHQGFLEDPSFLARFKREAQIVARLEHPHIVPVYDYNEYQGQPYLVMKFIEGATLKDDATHSTLPMKLILHVMTAVGSALTYAHNLGVLHRDIKPSNIVIDKRNTPYVTDFGLARMVQAGESTLSQDMILGTPHYISPEQAKGVRDLDARADIYSLGAVLYKLVVGQVPFTGDTPYAIIHDHIYTPLPLPSVVNPDVPPQVEAVLLKALAKNPNDRYASAVELVEAFRGAVQREPGVAQPKSRSAPRPTSKKGAPKTATSVGQKTPKLVSIPAPVDAYTQRASTPTVQRPQPRRNLWMLGGIGVLLVICVFSASIVLNVAGDLAQLNAFGTQSALSANTPIPGIASYDIPSVSVKEAQQALDEEPNNPVAHLALAKAFLEQGNPDEAQMVVSRGVGLVEQPLAYLINAARLAAQAGQLDVATNFYVQSLNRTNESQTVYPAIRAEVGQYLYDVAGTTQRLNIRQANQMSSRLPAGEAPIVRAMLARGLFTGGHPLLAQGILNELLEEDPALAEAHLVLGELRLSQNDSDQAIAEWQLAASTENTPAWVKSRAEALIEATTGG